MSGILIVTHDQPGRVLTREELHRDAWGREYRLGSNSLEVYVGYLRKKVGADVIETIRGRGYRLNPEARLRIL